MNQLDKLNKVPKLIPLFILFVIFNIYLTIIIKTERDKNSRQVNNLAESILNIKESQRNGFVFEDSHIQVDSLQYSATPVLCFYVSQLHCNPCIDSLIIQINNFCLGKPNIKFTILANYQTYKEFNLFKKIHRISDNALFINVKDNKSPIFNVNSPVLFIYNPSVSKTELVFFPNKIDVEQTLEFLEIVEYRFFKQSIAQK